MKSKTEAVNEPAGEPSPSRRLLLLAIKLTITAAVVAAVAYRVRSEGARLAAAELELNPAYLAPCALLYLIGLLPCALFWRRALSDSGQARLPLPATLLAYFAGHMAKYVPGKGLVVIVRAGLVKRYGVRVETAVATAVQETLLMMAVGALLASPLCLFLPLRLKWYLAAASGACGSVLALIAVPPVLEYLGRLVALPVRRLISGPVTVGRWSTLALGVAGMFAGWWLVGLSLLSLLAGIGQANLSAADWPLATALAGLAMVGGFISMLPGGLASREWILVELLGPRLGAAEALVAAVLLRLVWLAAECAATASFWTATKIGQAWQRSSRS